MNIIVKSLVRCAVWTLWPVVQFCKALLATASLLLTVWVAGLVESMADRLFEGIRKARKEEDWASFMTLGGLLLLTSWLWAPPYVAATCWRIGAHHTGVPAPQDAIAELLAEY